MTLGKKSVISCIVLKKVSDINWEKSGSGGATWTLQVTLKWLYKNLYKKLQWIQYVVSLALTST